MSTSTEPAPDQPVVLVVDDYPYGREVCVEYLSHFGFRVVEAATGEEALQLAHAERPDVVLMDLTLPDIDGTECMRRLRARAENEDAILIALTAHALESYARAARAAGADAVVTKPCVWPDLVALIRRELAARDSKKEAGGQP